MKAEGQTQKQAHKNAKANHSKKKPSIRAQLAAAKKEQKKQTRRGRSQRIWRWEAVNKFENVDVLAALEQIMCQNTAFYQDDFEIDKEMIRKAAASDKAEDKTPAVDVAPLRDVLFPGT